MNSDPLSKPIELANNQKKQPKNLFTYLILFFLGTRLFTLLFGNPSGREIEI